MPFLRSMRTVRIYICLIVLAFLSIGAVMIYSASSIYAWKTQGDSLYYLKRHLFYLLCGAVLMLSVMAINHQTLRKAAKPLFGAALLLLVLNFVPGISHEASGAKRWIRIGPLGFQPSEFIKVAFVVYLADFIARRKDVINNFVYSLLPAGIAVGFPTLLILLQPDLGTALSLVCVAAIMLFCSGLRYIYFISAAIVSMPVLYFLVFSMPYRRARIFSFLDPWADPMGKGFQIIQSQIAFGLGGLFGQGLGQGKQKLFYLPAAHTDFIFSVIGEEMGTAGAAMVIVLFIALVWLMIRVVRSKTDIFLRFVAIGIASLITLETVINLGVSLGMFPTKGLPLPFMSYGGSSLVFDMVAIGLLLNVSRTQEVYL